jgi:cyclohexanecarboxylate-CoA ligase
MVLMAPRLSPGLIKEYTRPGLWENRLLDDGIAEGAADYPDAVAVVDRRGSHTYSEIDADVSRLAAALCERGVRVGDVVSWQLPNWYEGVLAHLAAIRLGAVSNPVMPIYRQAEVGFILRQAASRAFIMPDRFRSFDYADMLRDLRGSLPDLKTVLVVGDKTPTGAEPFGEALAGTTGTPRASRDPNDICFLLYTSGTTAAPKGAMHSHNTLDYEARSFSAFFGLKRDDVTFMPSPLGHITGIMHGIQMPLMTGGSVVLQDIWRPDEAVRLMARHRCTVTVAATPFLSGLLDEPSRARHDLSALRLFACGGADVFPSLVRRATEELSCLVTRVYGSTEFPTATSTNRADPDRAHADVDGRAIGPVQMCITDSEGRPVPDGTPGELFLRGPELFLGYLDPALNDSAFRDDWFRTGDIAVRDVGGYIRITGRQKDIILRGGENISAREVEDYLIDHPAIADIAVIGYPDPVMVERVAAVVVLAPGAALGLPDVVAWLKGKGIAMQKIPERLMFAGELPRTPSGKIQKFKLRQQYVGLAGGAAAESPQA